MSKDIILSNENDLPIGQIKCIEMLIEGYRIEDIAKEIGSSPTQIWRWKQTKLFMAEWQKRKDNVSDFLVRSANKRFEKLQNSAIDVLAELLKDSKNDNVRMETAKEILNRNIGKIANKIEVTATTDIEDNGSVIDDIPDYEETELIEIE